MGLFSRLRQELIDIIEWVDDSSHTLVWRFPRFNNEIKNGASLIVRPGQAAVFVTEGRLADVFEPGHYKLTTNNLPILSTLAGWKHGFESPFKSEVYFVSTRQITDLKWGTPNPIMMRDPDFGPLRLRAFGTYSLKATDPKQLIKELVGTDQIFEAEEVTTLMRSIVNSSFADVLGEAKVAALDLAARYSELSEDLRKVVVERIDDEYGLDVPQLHIVNISLPEEVEKAMDTRSSMGVIGDMNRYQQFQMGNALVEAASNPGGGAAADGMGLGMGLAMAGQMANTLGQQGSFAAPANPSGMAGPPPLPPPPSGWHVAMDGKTSGPLGVPQLQSLVANGQLSPTVLVWTAGMSGWTAAGKVPQLAPLFAATPPPLPPPAP